MVYPATDFTADIVTDFLVTATTQTACAVPRSAMQGDAIAGYFIEDLADLLRAGRLNLAAHLHVPASYPRNPREVQEMLYADLTHLLRDGLLGALHLILFEHEPNEYDEHVVRYHARYLAQRDAVLHQDLVCTAGRVPPPLELARGARLALVIEWDALALMERRLDACRAQGYCFDWPADDPQPDDLNLLRFVGTSIAAKVVRLTEPPHADPFTIPAAT